MLKDVADSKMRSISNQANNLQKVNVDLDSEQFSGKVISVVNIHIDKVRLPYSANFQAGVGKIQQQDLCLLPFDPHPSWKG